MKTLLIGSHIFCDVSIFDADISKVNGIAKEILIIPTGTKLPENIPTEGVKHWTDDWAKCILESKTQEEVNTQCRLNDRGLGRDGYYYRYVDKNKWIAEMANVTPIL